MENIIKDNNTTDLCILTNPETNGVVNMSSYSNDKPIDSASLIEALESIPTHLDAIFKAFDGASKINSKIHRIIYTKYSTLFNAYSEFENLAHERIDEINELDAALKLTKDELSKAWSEMQEPENESPYAAGSANHDDYMENL